MTVIQCYVIDSAQDNDIFRMKVHYILPHSHQNL